MNAGEIVTYLLIGTAGGVCSGFFGLGGGIVIIPLLLWFLKLNQHQAQGLSLAALLLPVGALGFWKYYQAQSISLKPALLLALGIFVGAYFGAIAAQHLSDKQLRVAFGIFTIAAGIKLIVQK